MKKYLLDTNICIFFMRGKYKINEIVMAVGEENCFLSEITVAELLLGAYHSHNAKNIEGVKLFISYFEVLPITDCLDEFAKQKARLLDLGCTIENFDILIGSTAICNDAVMVTDNVKHLSRLEGIEVENWVKREE